MRIFNEKAPVIEPVNKALNEAVILSLAVEKKGLEADMAQVRIREERINWLEGLSEDWEMKERTRWRDVVPGVPKTKIRSGTKRSRSQSKAEQLKRKKKRA